MVNTPTHYADKSSTHINESTDSTDVLHDRYVIQTCATLKPPNYPAFISSSTRSSLCTFLSIYDGDNIDGKQVDTFPHLWKYLLDDAITYLKLKDKREWNAGDEVPTRDLIAFGVQELHTYFEEYRSFEAILYGADRFYRDHVMHVFRVWLLGMWLIESFNNKIDLDSKLKEITIDNDEIMAMWCIIALTHDLGYPLDKVEKVHEKINSMMRYFGESGNPERPFQTPVQHHFINDFILRFIGSKLIAGKKTRNEMTRRYKTALQAKFYLKLVSST